jgi:arginase
MKTIELFGAPVNLGAGMQGCSMGPCALRLAGVVDRLSSLDHSVADRGDLVSEPVEGLNLEGNANHLADITGWARTLEKQAKASLQAGNIPVFLGGDHALSMGTVSGAASYAAKAKKPLFVLWLDAHADYNTPQTSPSGNMHGMPVAFFTGKPGFEGILPNNRAVVKPSNVFIVGVRSIDRDERRALSDAGVNVYDMRALDEHGIATLLRSILKTVKDAGGMLHVSLDADFIDPSIAPGVGTAVNGGVTYREAHLAMEMLSDSALVTSLDVVELNPYLDERGKTAVLLAELIASLFGKRIFETVDAESFATQVGGQTAGRMLLSAK